jgi:hypothetical protein
MILSEKALHHDGHEGEDILSSVVTEAIVIVAYFTALFKSALGLNAQMNSLLPF